MPEPTQANRDELLGQCIELAKAEANGDRHACFCGMRDELAALRADNERIMARNTMLAERLENAADKIMALRAEQETPE